MRQEHVTPQNVEISQLYDRKKNTYKRSNCMLSTRRK